MNYQPIPYAWVLFLSAAVSVGIFVSAWRRREVPGTRPILLMMVATTLWSLANALEMMALDLNTKLFWANLQYISYNTIPLTWLAMTLQYTGQGDWLTKRRILLLLVIPILTISIAFTNQWHGLLRQDIFLDSSGSFPVVGKTYGPWFWIHAAYTYPLMIAAAIIHIKAMLPRPSLYRWQTLSLLTGLVLPVLASLAFTFKLSPFKFDITPTLFSVGSIFYVWGLRRFKLFDILPAAYNMAIKSMGDGIIIFDDQDRIIDLNPAAERIIGNSKALVGKNLAEINKGQIDLEKLLESATTDSQILIGGMGETRYYEARCWPIAQQGNKRGGRILLLHEVTDTVQANQKLSRQQELTAVLNERERLGRELHDSVGQVLSYVNVQTQAVKKLVADGQTSLVDSHLEKIIAAARESHADIRKFIKGTVGTAEDETGLFLLIQDSLRNFGENYGFITHYVDNLNRKYAFGPEVKTEVLRIVQASLANIREHSEASQVWIKVIESLDQFEIKILDDGKGFVWEEVDTSKHFGLQIMQERARKIKGDFQITSNPGVGTEVSITLPLHLYSLKSTVTD